jgi:hypothetical protein
MQAQATQQTEGEPPRTFEHALLGEDGLPACEQRIEGFQQVHRVSVHNCRRQSRRNG